MCNLDSSPHLVLLLQDKEDWLDQKEESHLLEWPLLGHSMVFSGGEAIPESTLPLKD